MGISTLSPEVLGLPEKFSDFRPAQIDALERISQSDKKVILLQAPTGSGKTLIMPPPFLVAGRAAAIAWGAFPPLMSVKRKGGVKIFHPKALQTMTSFPAGFPKEAGRC